MGTASSKHNHEEGDRVVVAGRPNFNRCDNMIVTSKYTAWSFVPVAVGEQFRRFANLYFLIVGIIMAIGYYSSLYESAISPWTTLGPLAFVICISLSVEGSADIRRHRSDEQTNNATCVVLRRAEDIDQEDGAERDKTIMSGKDVIVNLSKNYFQTSSNQTPDTPKDPSMAKSTTTHLAHVGFQKIKRMNIRQGHIILIKNREMVPADTILLASSGDNGCAYIETSSIDGETNLKLRSSPQLPPKLQKHLRDGTPMDQIPDELDIEGPVVMESVEQAAKRVTRFSALAYPDGISAVDHPGYTNKGNAGEGEFKRNRLGSMLSPISGMSGDFFRSNLSLSASDGGKPHYIAALTSEPPNPHINTFSGKLTLPPVESDGHCIDIPLGAENILLRGAVLRNTEWAIGLSCFTGTDTKLVQNSFQTPSKFSQLDMLMNKCVLIIVIVMALCITYLATSAVITWTQYFDQLWYIGYNLNTTAPWPYLEGLEAPAWDEETQNWFQMFFLYVTLVSNFVPLSMYVTVEMVNFFFLWLVVVDIEMYDAKTDTRAAARSTNVTDLGQVEFIFSDKTGTLTQNVMRFKRCSVDGMIFGPPVEKARPLAENDIDNTQSPFHPTRQLLVGQIKVGGDGNRLETTDEMTFNAEMFLRVMSLCHTVVVEKDLDLSGNIDEAMSVSSAGSSWSSKNYAKKFFTASKNRERTTSDMSAHSGLEPVTEDSDQVPTDSKNWNRNRAMSTGSAFQVMSAEKGPDGAPVGFAYQAESPDEGALVSAASNAFGFQVIGRDSSGIKLKCDHPTIFGDRGLTYGLKSGALSPKKLAADTATGKMSLDRSNEVEGSVKDSNGSRTETWEILAVNKFDSERKRMSILLRSPPELGSVVILFCKGADSAMLDPSVCLACSTVFTGVASDDMERSQRLYAVSEVEDDETELEMAQMLGIQSHLGEFAKEGLRTLVLGIRFLTDTQCEQWLEIYKCAATSMKDRDQMLKDAAFEIEKDLHVVGATAIEDKLQTGVPNTIATLEDAGIQLWVLTGDKRETAIEIGYSTRVLTPRMHLTEVVDKGAEFVRAQCAMEFMRLVKAGKLPLYQRAVVDQSDAIWSWENASFVLGKCSRSCSRAIRRFIVKLKLFLCRTLDLEAKRQENALEMLDAEQKAENAKLKDVVRRLNVRNRAETIIKDYSKSHPSIGGTNILTTSSDADELSSDDIPPVFNRAQSARTLLNKRSSLGKLTESDRRRVRMSQLTAQEVQQANEAVLEEDLLSLNSFYPIAGETTNDFDMRRRTMLERLFAVDRDVRKGRLVKHLKKEKRLQVLAADDLPHPITPSGDGPRALVVEGAALKHLLGDHELEELVFNIASQCDAVIACRVSPRQKALLVKLVRQHVVPEPVTLAIGDGANDVGMIQEAHVGIGISGKEGKQAVNASDFAIAQFRFLENLILIHGRWDFMRSATVVLYSFYKNAVMAGCLVVYNAETLYSGTPLFDQWIIAVLNFVAGLPILLLGMFDRCLEKDYIRKNPEVFQPTRQNEIITMRVLFRWVVLAFAHIFILYYGSLPQLSGPGGMTSSFQGLMRHRESVGDGSVSDLQSVGTVIFTNMILVLAYKILYESRSIINGLFPALLGCRKNAKEGFFSRLPYTWYGVTYGSIIFYICFLFIYQKIGKKGPGEYFQLVGVPNHIFGTSSLNYISMLFVPIFGMAFDLAGKVFSNMFYPTQTQIHVELESREFAEKRKRRRQQQSHVTSNGVATESA